MDLKCEHCGAEKVVAKFTMKVIDGQVVIPERQCACGREMTDVTEREEGFPTIIRNE